MDGKSAKRPTASRHREDDGSNASSRAHPLTPDGRYFVVSGRLWRSTNPAIPEDRRRELVAELMDARRAVKEAKRGHGDLGLAHARVDFAKNALGERGPVWWDDGSPDLNRHMAKNTCYAEWAAKLKKSGEIV